MRAITPFVLLLSLSGCGGGGLEGTYTGENAGSGERTGFLDSLTFKPGNKVDATFMGQTRPGSYVVDGKQVTITIGNDSSPEVLTIASDGCLEHGGLMGRYCRDEKSSAVVREAEKKAVSLVGTYEARHDEKSEQGLRLEFKGDQTVTISFIGPGAPQSESAPYTVDGEQVHVGPPGAPPAMEFTRDGDALGMTDGAKSVRFQKQ